LAGGGELGEAEVHNFCVASSGDEKISGLDVAMNDTGGVSGIEAVGDLDAPIEEGFGVERAAVDVVFEGLAVEKFHGDEVAAFEFVDFVDGADVGMVEGGGGLGFALETFERLSVASEIFGKKFEGDETAELGVFGFVNDAHAAAAEFFEDAVVRDGLADHLFVHGADVGGEFRPRGGASQRGWVGKMETGKSKMGRRRLWWWRDLARQWWNF